MSDPLSPAEQYAWLYRELGVLADGLRADRESLPVGAEARLGLDVAETRLRQLLAADTAAKTTSGDALDDASVLESDLEATAHALTGSHFCQLPAGSGVGSHLVIADHEARALVQLLHDRGLLAVPSAPLLLTVEADRG